jgi:AcrR family transcriptional regulator
LTIEAIAARAGVGKQTVYRWWPSKGAVVAEAVLDDDGGIRPLLPTVDQDMPRWVGDIAVSLADERGAAMLRALVSAASEDAVIAQRLYDRFTGPFLEAVKSQFTAALNRQGADVSEIETAADMLVGALVFRVLTRTEPLTRSRAKAVLQLVLNGLVSD